MDALTTERAGLEPAPTFSEDDALIEKIVFIFQIITASK